MSNVLLAEDDVTMVKLLETLLKMEGYQVSALDADASVAEAVLADPPDILLMDVHLSNNNGIEELKKITRRARRGRRARADGFGAGL